MDSFELNKIAGAVLATLLVTLGLNIFSGIIFAPRPAGDAGYPLPVPQEDAAPQGTAAPAAQTEPLPVLLASADVAKGQAAVRKCASCHSFDKGGPNRVGPNLHEVVGRPKAAVPNFSYSAALKGKGGEWTFEDINAFIQNPKGYANGPTMAFAGVGSAAERADILAYLRSLSDSPKPLPTQ